MFNVDRTYPAPASLALRRSYSEEDVMEELRKIFFDKCYICESKEPSSLNVEHFFAHQGDEDKKFDWNNLFYVCGRCNNIKLHHYNNLLNCTDRRYDVFRLIKLLPPRLPHDKVEVEAMNDDDKTLETAELLGKIFNPELTVNKKITGLYIRKKFFKKPIDL